MVPRPAAAVAPPVFFAEFYPLDSYLVQSSSISPRGRRALALYQIGRCPEAQLRTFADFQVVRIEAR
jgi:hypothetical protein